MDVHPLMFEPIYQPRLWGGRRLKTFPGRRLPEGACIGESWELSDLPGAESVVRAGPSKGRTLRQLIDEWGARLTGNASLVGGRFPLLLKYLDAAENLSVQVHPPPDADPEVAGPVKHEAWIVLQAEPGGCIYRGLRAGVTPESLQRAQVEGTVERLLERIEVRAGQAFYLPAGVVHALGGGVMVAEVQTPGDVTYRLYDWNRLDPLTGRPRELHVEQALRCLRDAGNLSHAEARSHVASVWTSVTRLVTCESFVVERVRMIEGVEQDIPYAEPVVWMVLSGSGEVTCSFEGEQIAFPFQPADTILLPAGMSAGRVHTHSVSTWLEITLPIPSSLAGFERPDRAQLRGIAAPPAGVVPLAIRPEKSDKG